LALRSDRSFARFKVPTLGCQRSDTACNQNSAGADHWAGWAV